jgi:hypothetical protein
MSDAILEQIKAAQSAPADIYMAWAEIGADQIVLHSVQVLPSIDAEIVLSGVRAQGKQTLADCGYSAEQIAGAFFHLSALPSAEETEAELEARRGPDVSVVLVDLAMWEACRHRLHLSPYSVGRDEQEMDFKGLKIRRSAAD